jgi:hypothetical protein
MKKYGTRKLTMLAMTMAVAMVLSYIESQIPAFVAVPGVKVGLANIAVIFALYRFGFKEACLVSFVRVLVMSMLFGLGAIFYSRAGAVLSVGNGYSQENGHFLGDICKRCRRSPSQSGADNRCVHYSRDKCSKVLSSFFNTQRSSGRGSDRNSCGISGQAY